MCGGRLSVIQRRRRNGQVAFVCLYSVRFRKSDAEPYAVTVIFISYIRTRTRRLNSPSVVGGIEISVFIPYRASVDLIMNMPALIRKGAFINGNKVYRRLCSRPFVLGVRS